MVLQRKTEEEREEVLSLCDLPITNDGSEGRNITNEENRSTQDEDFFGFFNGLNAEMCAAEDIFQRWKMRPDTGNECRNRSSSAKKSYFRVRAESVEESHVSNAEVQTPWNRDCRTLERASSSIAAMRHRPMQMHRRVQNAKGFDSPPEPKAPSRPKWYLLMFGSMKMPAEMEIKDIRSRQRRRNPSPSPTLFPSFDESRKVSGVNSKRKLLRAFSCKGHATAVVRASPGCVPHV